MSTVTASYSTMPNMPFCYQIKQDFYKTDVASFIENKIYINNL